MKINWTDWSNDWRTYLLIQIMSRCLEVQADHRNAMKNVTKTDALVPDEYIFQGKAEFGAELEQLMKEVLATQTELITMKEEDSDE
tara:strand:- start:10711 stop:10968 length:258 start_codon:yes stop_codon:yes gene_type:complete